MKHTKPDMRAWYPTVLAVKVQGKWWFLDDSWVFQPDPFCAKVFLKHGGGLRALFTLDKSNLPGGYDTGEVRKFHVTAVPHLKDLYDANP